MSSKLAADAVSPDVLKKYERAPVMAPEEYKALHPIGSAPVIEDGALKLAESGACVEYIAQTYGKGRFIVAPGAKNYADYLYWFRKEASPISYSSIESD